jgi:NAD(P)-dependent dehydrogenase (short-subunit alcohol dehydrogenase family)
MTERVFILGGGGGIGGALARAITVRGGRVFLAGRDAAKLEAVADSLGAGWAAVDAADPDAVDACADQAAEALGGLSGIACCAGSLLLKPAHLTTTPEWQATLTANLTTAFGCVRAAGRLLKAEGGSVVLVSSAAARIGLANHEAIAAAKAGIIGLVLSAAATYARQKIRFNAVAPGLVRTPLTQGLVASELAEKASIGMHPLGRLGTPDDVARAIAFLLDPAQDWITGQVLGVDGGLASLKTRTG